jgi:sirohydrochlorin cobaltochelatase
MTVRPLSNMSAIEHFLETRLAAGGWVIGQIEVRPDFSLRHVDDRKGEPANVYRRPGDAREIAKYDDAGAYRPLKTAPNLRHGWELRLRDVGELRLALDLLYPATVGTWLVFERGELTPVPLRDTLNRQTGMYRITQLIRDDQALELVERTCRAGCLRHRLWSLSGPATNNELPREPLPVLCAEACNLLVAACRPLAKENLPKAG